MQIIGCRAHVRVPCRKQISSGYTLKKQCFSPATPRPTRKSKVCLILRGLGRKRRYYSERPPVIMTANLRAAPHNSCAGSIDGSEMFIAHLLRRTIRVEAYLVDQLFNSSEKRLARMLLLLANFGKDTKP